ncbi:MAG: pyridoxal phosphate-dependent aminotransferase [Saprospiraceae bacterium]|nr:pyridoxal phosphate-dependent aminotransferase [Saprospiraceae bacterium]MCB9322152.1 pyridoxal phosphate-dependent aminotransferase [Lewinellaceae bacterium]
MSKEIVSKRLEEMEESATLKMSQLARDLKAQGHDVINLSLGEPDFDTPVHIKEAAKQALDDGYTKYTPVPGLIELREAIKTKFKRDNNLDYNINEIVVSNGAKQSIANLSLALLDEGDEVIILAPYWVSYFEIIRLSGATPVLVSAGIEQDYKVTAAQIEAAITDKTRFILYSSPCNPTGSVYNEAELRSFADVIAKYDDVYIVSDEIYEYINFGDKHISIGSFENVKDRTITVNGFAKGFAMTGWRLGYMGAPKWIADACTKIQGQFTSGASSFGQKAAAHALLSDLTPTYKMCEAFRKRRDMMIAKLSEIPGFKVNMPNGAFYIFPDISHFFGKSDGQMTINNADDFCEYLLHKAHVATVSGGAFGADNCFRISYAASDEQLIESAKRIKEAVARLK